MKADLCIQSVGKQALWGHTSGGESGESQQPAGNRTNTPRAETVPQGFCVEDAAH